MALRVTLVCPIDEAYDLNNPDAHAQVTEDLTHALQQIVDLSVRSRPKMPRPIMVLTDDPEVD